MLCWRAPEAAHDVLDASELPDTALRETWLAFLDVDAGGGQEHEVAGGGDLGAGQQDQRGRDLGAEPDVAFFPAYALLAEPGLAARLPDDLAGGDGRGEQAFRAMRALLRADGVEARRALRAAAPWLLAAYLEARAQMT